jgi:hypothetical protein
MAKNYSECIQWSADEFKNFGKVPQVSPHTYNKLDLFSDETLTTLLDNYPRQWLQCYTMGFDPENHQDWTPVHIADNTGAEILEALQRGRMWVNVINIDKYNGEYAELIRQMYVTINDKCDHITNAKSAFSALILSSPGVQVYCHIDADANMLWHLKGRKRVWVYPARDERFTPQTYIEEIIGQERHEDIPYERWFDDHAISHELQPGEAISWPQHSPHRVENVDFNVSLTTSYGSAESRRQLSVHGANHHILKPLGITRRSTELEGVVPAFKELCYRGMNVLKLLNQGKRNATNVTDLQVDAQHPQGMSKRDDKSLTKFAYADKDED